MGRPIAGGRQRIGLLGGSFNPAHEGHRFASLAALRRLKLDRLWWLVSPQNPLKGRADMAPLAQRLAGAALRARHPRIEVTDIERDLGTRFTVDTVARLRRRYPRARFVWLAGADILLEMHRWRRWRRLLSLVRIAVFDRPGYSYRAKVCAAAQAMRFGRRRESAAASLWRQPVPAWVFLHGRRHSASATALRRTKNGSKRLPSTAGAPI
jgi:nicotinate-nucleotide adenylyltransferase